MSSLKDGDCHLIVAIEVNQLVSEVFGPCFDGSHDIYHLQMADRMISCEKVSRKLDVIGSCTHNGTLASPNATCINKQVDRLPVLFLNDIDTLGGLQILLEPVEIIGEVRRQCCATIGGHDLRVASIL